MKLVRSKRFPDRQPQVIPDDQWEQMKKAGRAKHYTAIEFAPVKKILTALELPEINKVSKPKKVK